MNIVKISFNEDLNRFPPKQVSKMNILIIGGAGTIGSNYIKQILKFKPGKLVVVDTNENGLTELTRDLRSSNLLDYKPEYITYPVNLLSETFDKIFWSEDFDLIANFSAHKHVRSEKDKISVEALIKNNVYGAIKLLELCTKRPPKYFFSVSTEIAFTVPWVPTGINTGVSTVPCARFKWPHLAYLSFAVILNT